MARQRMSNKNTKKYREKLNLPIKYILVRGGTDHRKDLCLKDGSVIHMYKDGTLEKSTMKWGRKKV